MALTIVILQLAVCILAFPMYLLHFLDLCNWIGKQWFPYFLARFTVMYNKQMASKKQELFSNLWEFTGPSGKLSLLELGCGTRANFKFYPSRCQVTCKFLIKSIAQNPHLQFECFIVAAGENMQQVATGSMDVVVCTLMLCLVKNQEQILQEVCRVLSSNHHHQGQSSQYHHVRLFETPWIVACQASLSFTISWGLFKLMSIERYQKVSIHLFHMRVAAQGFVVGNHYVVHYNVVCEIYFNFKKEKPSRELDHSLYYPL
uniref:Methyltransferase type 11 domain-containing protein n=1 Tax=Capra hircus TaxID=9925 RepID=A0A8C2N6J2_CAPHI